MRRILWLSVALLWAGARGQVGFNIDLNCEFCPPPLGGGAPSDEFAGASEANQPGRWNALPDTGHFPIALYDLQGNLTNVFATGNGGGAGGGWRFEGNTGDYALLENDGNDVVSESTWLIDRLTPGMYRIVTYAIKPADRYNITPVVVQGVTKYVTGPMLSNDLVEGVTHTVHDVPVDGQLSITVKRGESYNGFINGFQIVPIVPEPATFAGLGLGFLALSRRLRRRSGDIDRTRP